MTGTERERGFVAVEWVAAIAVLMLPVVVLVATLPNWAERRHAATVAAREAAAVAVVDAVVDPASAQRVATQIAQNYGIDASDIDIRIRAGAARGEYVTVDVSVRMPAVAVPGLVHAGRWTYTATQHRRLDDYRSR